MPTKRKSNQKAKEIEKKKNDKKTEKKIVKDDADVSIKKPPKFKFVCQKCGICCKSEPVYLTINDLERWIRDNTVYRVMHLMKLVEDSGNLKIILKKDDDGYCNLFHRDNNECTIYDSRPTSCRAFPLGFNGEQYYVKNKDCIGLGKSGMSIDQLKIMRNEAFEEQIAFRQIDSILPLLNGIVFTKIIEDSQQFMNKLSDKEKEDIVNLAKKEANDDNEEQLGDEDENNNDEQ